jgi:hypothetical protein
VPAKPFAIVPCMSEAGTDSVAQDLRLELGEDGRQRGRGAAGGCGQIERFGQRYEADAEMFQLLKGCEQVGQVIEGIGAI